MVKCVFCETEIPVGTGLIFVYKVGKVVNFCSPKCEKHALKLNRKPHDMKWVTSKKK